MGQYYFVAFKRGDGNVVVNERKFKNSEYVGAKLMEHSYIGNWFCNSVLADIAKNGKTRIAWVGDYAEDEEIREITNGDLCFKDVWGDHDNPHRFGGHVFGYRGKFLVNHSKRKYVSFDGVMKFAKREGLRWPINPLPLLTAIGNGRGGGDYSGENESLVGTWAWDEISVEKSIPAGYEPEDAFFKEF